MAAEDYKVQWVGRHALVTMPAEIDVVNSGEIRQALLAAASVGAEVLVIDMSGTTFCDSGGVQAIIATYKWVKETRTQLRLVATAVLRILTLVGVDQLTPIYPTLEAALTGGPSAQTGPHEPGETPASAEQQ